jgi:hypothetical protein
MFVLLIHVYLQDQSEFSNLMFLVAQGLDPQPDLFLW